MNFEKIFIFQKKTKINKKKITSDKLISLLDYQKIQENINLSKAKVVLEIGAGSGRFSQTFLTFHKKTKYIIWHF